MQKNYWKKLFNAVGVCLLLGMFTAQAEVAGNALTPAEKCADRDLSFGLTFDKYSTAADFALGEPETTTFKGNLEFRIFKGFDGKNAFNRRGIDELLRYKADKNVNGRQGTVIFWAMANNYSPKDIKSSDKEKCHKPYLYINLVNGKQWQHLFFYQYYDDPRAMLYWQSSACNPNVYKLASASLNLIGKGEWFQITGTWDRKEIKIYLNGKLINSTALPQEGMLPETFIPSSKASWIGVRESMWGAKGSDPGKETVIDDIKIYSRALSGAEVMNQYLKAAPEVKGAGVKELTLIDIELNGVDDGKGQPDRLEAVVDFSPMDSKWQAEIGNGAARTEYTLVTPSKKIITGNWDSNKIKDFRILKDITEPGEYVFTLKTTAKDGKSVSAAKKIIRPDTSWYGNKIGLDDVVPPPWTPMSIDADNTIKVWNREYYFGNNPLPQKIINGGESILSSAPELVVMTPSGKADIKWQVTGRKQTNTVITLSGTGTAKTFTINWTTRVEFDGFIRWDFVIDGKPEVTSMKLVWTVDKKFSKFVMDPLLQVAGNGKYESLFPYDPRRSATVLWLTSDRKGFCWAPQHDANWVYGKDEKIIKADISDRGGACEINMITRKVTIPDGAEYHAMFTSTPARPLPEKSRTFRFGGYARHSNCDVALVQHVGEGFESVFTLKLSPYFGDHMDFLLNPQGTTMGRMKKLMPYHAASVINSYDAAGNYFGKYWEISGSGTSDSFPLRPTGKKLPDEKTVNIITADPGSSYSDYIMWNMKETFNHPKQRYVGMYYDISDNQVSANPLNGSRFTDKFGRDVNSLIIMGLRRHMMRTMRFCHETGRVTMYHAHSYYNPMAHVFADYWFPGEQYCSLMQAKRTPYYYSDFITDNEYRSELNMHLKGSGIIFLGNMKRSNLDWGNEEQTKAMCTKLLLNDIPMSMAYEDGSVINKIWGIVLKYKLDNAGVNFYYSQNEITGNNKNIGITYYKCPDGRYLAMIGNLTKETQTGTIDISNLKKGLDTVTDEYDNLPVAVKKDQFVVAIPARHFKIIGF